MLETTVPLNHSTEDESVSDDALELDLGGTTQSVFREMSQERASDEELLSAFETGTEEQVTSPATDSQLLEAVNGNNSSESDMFQSAGGPPQATL